MVHGIVISTLILWFFSQFENSLAVGYQYGFQQPLWDRVHGPPVPYLGLQFSQVPHTTVQHGYQGRNGYFRPSRSHPPLITPHQNTHCIAHHGRPGICKEISTCEDHYVRSFGAHSVNREIFKCKLYDAWDDVSYGLCCPLPESHHGPGFHPHVKYPHHLHHDDHQEDHDDRKHHPNRQHDHPHDSDTRSESSRRPKPKPRPKHDLKCKVMSRPLKPARDNSKKDYEITRDLITSKSINTSLNIAHQYMKEHDIIDKLLLKKNLKVQKGTPAAGHLRFSASSDKISKVSKLGDIFYETSLDLSKKLHLNKAQKITGLKFFNVSISSLKALSHYCPASPGCEEHSKYRSADGSCNNLDIPKLGQALTPLTRLLSPAYADGVWAPRIAADCSELPSARLLSQSFIKDADIPSKKYSLFVMQFGQFLDHDFTSVPVFRFDNQSGIRCCSDGKFLQKENLHMNCLPIGIPVDDPFYRPHGQRCMNFVRSRLAPRIDCSLGYADQMNALTHWIDASNIYGSDDEEMDELRLGKNGLLKFSKVSGSKNILLPLREVEGDGCTDPLTGKFCFRSGDFRVNEMLGLMVTHLVWFREHNRLATELKKLNDDWNDETLFQEARRILIAEYQHIIYNEWVPIIIGEEYMRENDIFPLEEGFSYSYDSDVDGSIASEFQSAAFRMGHSLVQGIVNLFNRLGENNHKSVISENSNDPHAIRGAGRVDDWLRGLTRSPVQSYDNRITAHLNGRLFQPKNMKFGLDLSSLNIQRARDHGVQGYNAYREFCGLERAKDFDDFEEQIPKNIIELMKVHYNHVDDVDLWIGGINEKPGSGKLIGPTFACIIGDQFTRSKKADRFFYDVGDQEHSFSEAQLKQIRKASFARIICDNGDNIKEMQTAAFLLPDDEENPMVDCRDDAIASIDLAPWS